VRARELERKTGRTSKWANNGVLFSKKWEVGANLLSRLLFYYFFLFFFLHV
jgi:hypothetical protein